MIDRSRGAIFPGIRRPAFLFAGLAIGYVLTCTGLRGADRQPFDLHFAVAIGGEVPCFGRFRAGPMREGWAFALPVRVATWLHPRDVPCRGPAHAGVSNRSRAILSFHTSGAS